MSKKFVKIMSLTLACLVLASAASFAITQKFTLFVLTKEKTVLADNQEITSLVDFKYFVKKGVTVVTEEAGVYLSYRGNLITGIIKVKSLNPLLDNAKKSDKALSIDYLHSKNKVTTKYMFTSCKITDIEIKKKKGKIVEVIYIFRATGLNEEKV